MSRLTVGVLVGALLGSVTASGQQVMIEGPFQTMGDSFFERTGVDFGFGTPGRGFFFNQGSFDSTIPPFGGYDPNSVGRTGFQVGPFRFRAEFGQGNTRTFSTEAPFVTVPNGGTGTVIDASARPFVTGIVPVVAGDNWSSRLMALQSAGQLDGLLRQMRNPATTSVSPLAGKLARLREEGGLPSQASATASSATSTAGKSGGGRHHDSTATRGDISVSEIRRQQASGDDAEREQVLALLERASGAEQEGKLAVAKVYYQQAAKIATGDLKAEATRKLADLKSSARRQ